MKLLQSKQFKFPINLRKNNIGQNYETIDEISQRNQSV